jgi:heterodisulfide reductase subunit A
MQKETIKPVVVLGGGIAGITAALELSRAGLPAVLVEKSPFFGGLAASFGCKATDVCQKCGACRVEQGLRDLAGAPNLTLKAHTELVASQSANGGLRLTLKSQPRVIDPQLCTNCGLCLEECPAPRAVMTAASAENHPRFAVNPAACLYFQDGSCRRCQEICPPQAIDLSRAETEISLTTPSLIVATGFQPAQPPPRGDYTNEELPNIITGWELEEMIKGGGMLVRPNDGQPVRRVGFIQCVGSRDTEHTYCSRVCCAYGLRLARLLRHRWPETQVSTFYMDLQNVGPDPKAFEDAVSREIELIRALPGDLMATGDGSLRVRFLDEASGQPLFRVLDLLVLVVGIHPSPDNPRLAQMLHLELDADGFLQDGHPTPASAGIFLAGTAAGPQNILECIAQAARSVQQVRQYLAAPAPPLK